MKFIKDNIKMLFKNICVLTKGDAEEALKYTYFNISKQITIKYFSEYITSIY